MNNRTILLAISIGVIGVLASCSEKGSNTVDVGTESGQFYVSRDGIQFIRVSQFLNGSRVWVVTSDGSSILLTMPRDMSTIREVYFIKPLDEVIEGEEQMKYISISEELEVEIQCTQTIGLEREVLESEATGDENSADGD